jgi:hypothetical protein
VHDVDDLRRRFTLYGLTIEDETSSDGTEGYRVKGIKRGKQLDFFLSFSDVQPWLEAQRHLP